MFTLRCLTLLLLFVTACGEPAGLVSGNLSGSTSAAPDAGRRARPIDENESSGEALGEGEPVEDSGVRPDARNTDAGDESEEEDPNDREEEEEEGIDGGPRNDGSVRGDGGATVDGGPVLDGGLLPFAAVCTVDAECADGTCGAFGQLGRACTKTCQVNADCPVGSQGQRCNNQGLCRP